jgi:hypothetical protein
MSTCSEKSKDVRAGSADETTDQAAPACVAQASAFYLWRRGAAGSAGAASEAIAQTVGYRNCSSARKAVLVGLKADAAFAHSRRATGQASSSSCILGMGAVYPVSVAFASHR